MIQGMLGFMSQIEGRNAALPGKVLIKCSTLNMVIGIETEEDISEEFFNELLQLAGSAGCRHFLGRWLPTECSGSAASGCKRRIRSRGLHGNRTYELSG